MKLVSPRQILQSVASAVPADCHGEIIVVGSVAAGYRFFGNDPALQVRTKDVDCLLAPRVKAVAAGRSIAERLLACGWHFPRAGTWQQPGTASTPDDQLPAVRLYPPNSDDWFVELLTVPDASAERGKRWLRLELAGGHFGLVSFDYLSLAAHAPTPTDFGIQVARVEMMALANLLEHREIRPERMIGKIEDRAIRRSNKDLGRVLAIARLAGDAEIASWPGLWEAALRSCFPEDWQERAQHAGDGLRQLLGSPADMDEAHHACVYGLLASLRVTSDELRFTGLRLVADAIVPLAESARA
ncbi:MAG: hypothetical protein K8T90_19070 [Planctomycetes bacterium]|nr:hypothetical protein [Planctomycetota bacterium]